MSYNLQTILIEIQRAACGFMGYVFLCIPLLSLVGFTPACSYLLGPIVR